MDLDFPAVPLDDPDPKYALGTIIGCLYGTLCAMPDEPVEATLPFKGLEMALRIAKATHRDFRLIQTTDCKAHGTTYTLRFEPAPEPV